MRACAVGYVAERKVSIAMEEAVRFNVGAVADGRTALSQGLIFTSLGDGTNPDSVWKSIQTFRQSEILCIVHRVITSYSIHYTKLYESSIWQC